MKLKRVSICSYNFLGNFLTFTDILRTHTTAVSARMLYKLAQTGFRPAKLFSIDRVFRNETLDATHLAEFHQIEGLVADYSIFMIFTRTKQ